MGADMQGTPEVSGVNCSGLRGSAAQLGRWGAEIFIAGGRGAGATGVESGRMQGGAGQATNGPPRDRGDTLEVRESTVGVSGHLGGGGLVPPDLAVRAAAGVISEVGHGK